jgi:hypothetical protein
MFTKIFSRLARTTWQRIFGFQPLLILLSSCVYHDLSEEFNCEQSSLTFEIKSVNPTKGCDQADGSVNFTAKGGRKPYQFSHDGITWNYDSSISLLNATHYSFQLKDGNGCIQTVDTLIHTTAEFPGSIITTPHTSCGSDNGSIEINITNGAGFLFRVDGGELTSNNFFEGIGEGEHQVLIQNPEGCVSILTTTVDRNDTGVSWVNEILPIMTTYCSKSGCHDGISRGNDWRIYEQVKTNAQVIKQNTQTRNMPFDQLLPQEKIDLIQCWVDDGAPNN